MTSPVPQQVPCPHCQQTTEASPLSVLQEGAPEIDQLFDGSLNRVPCQACGKTFLFETPLLYRDDEAHYLVYYLPRALAGNLDEALRQMDTLYRRVFADLAEDERPDCRLATQRGHFIEKIALHQFDYDDRLVEYIKYLLFQHNPGLDPVRHELLFDFGNSDGENLMFIAFGREKGQPEYSLGITAADYHELAESFLATPELEAELDKLFRPYFVTVESLLK
jgi:hypothetical protein